MFKLIPSYKIAGFFAPLILQGDDFPSFRSLVIFSKLTVFFHFQKNALFAVQKSGVPFLVLKVLEG